MTLILKIFKLFLLLFLLFLLFGYFYLGPADLKLVPGNKNFSFNQDFEDKDMQFYKNMRFSYPDISYKISDSCTLKKKDEVQRTFKILEDETILNFYPVQEKEQISIKCENKQRINKDFYVAGEGGPVDIIYSGNFNVIKYGEILLIRHSECSNPNIALHEILHVLGFKHSQNPENIMYKISSCSQELGEEIPNFINKLYTVPAKPDLTFSNVSISLNKRFLNLNATIKNYGLIDSEKFFLNIYLDNKIIKTIEIEPIKIGSGMKISIEDLYIGIKNFDSIKIIIENNFDEINKENNEIVFYPENK